jgi:hypothetical protein
MAGYNSLALCPLTSPSVHVRDSEAGHKREWLSEAWSGERPDVLERLEDFLGQSTRIYAQDRWVHWNGYSRQRETIKGRQYPDFKCSLKVNRQRQSDRAVLES